MATFIPSTGALTGAISATAVISATGLFATPAAAESHASTGTQFASPHAHNALEVSPSAVERALAPAAAPVVIATAAPAAVATAVHVTHTVVRGDTVWDLARHYGSTVTAIVDANGLDAKATIRVGAKLVIPGASSKAAPAKAAPAKAAPAKKTTTASTHTVKSGDTVWAIAQKYGSSVSAIISANHLNANALIRVGQRLTIPGATKATPSAKPATASGSTSSSTTASARYTVKQGDTLSAIASRFGSSVAAIAGANGIENASKIRVGQVLTIPGGVPTGLVGDTFLGRTYSSDVVSGANANKQILNDSSVPTRAQMRSIVESTAKKYGVPVPLALAIAYQESGFDQRAVSPANAVGTMQVIPSTGEWISTMVGRELDLLDPNDNVTAGVVLLSYLTRNADSLDQAIAGYYQGLAGVRKNGMNPDTKKYVASVRALMVKFS